MKKTLALVSASLVLASGLWADDSFFSGGFGEEGFGDGEFTEESAAAVEINGSLTTSVRAYVSPDAVDAMADLNDEADEVEAATEIGLTFTYEGTDFKVVTDFEFTPELAEGDVDSMVSINEAYGQYFGEKMNFEAGFMKVVWGKADEFHVVDVLNNTNFSEFIIPEYLDMIDPELMFKVNIPVGMSGMLELAYVPTLTVDQFDEEGLWTPMEGYDLAVFASSNSLTKIDTNTNTFDYGQAAVHFTSTFGGFDYGFTYYAGYNKMPSLNYSIADTEYWYEYDPMHTFGVEAAYILGGFNFKGEFAYNMTYDFSGDETDVHNNNIRWVGGFDRDIPLSNLNINIQEAGSYILNNDEITSLYDIEYDADDEYTQNLLIVAISDTYLHEKLEVEVITFYHFEDSDYGIYPSIEYTLVDDLTVGLDARFFGGDDDTLFGQYSENDFVELTVSYNF